MLYLWEQIFNMTNGTITNRELYEAIEKLEDKIGHRLEKMEMCVDENTNWRNRVMGQLTIMMIIIGTAINWAWSQLFKD